MLRTVSRCLYNPLTGTQVVYERFYAIQHCNEPIGLVRKASVLIGRARGPAKRFERIRHDSIKKEKIL